MAILEFRKDIEITDSVYIDVSEFELHSQLKDWDAEDLEQLRTEINIMIADKRGAPNIEGTLYDKMIDQEIDQLRDKLTLQQIEEIKKEYL